MHSVQRPQGRVAVDLNYELIYKVRKSGVNTQERENLRISYANAARAKADIEYQKYLDLLEELLGHTRIAVTNEMCLADGITGHVFTWEEKFGEGGPDKGLGKRHCVFCGCDDFDD
jgi:glutathione S-transferase